MTGRANGRSSAFEATDPVLLLRKKFGTVPQSVVERIEATLVVELLDRWLEDLLSAQKLTDVGIKPL